MKIGFRKIVRSAIAATLAVAAVKVSPLLWNMVRGDWMDFTVVSLIVVWLLMLTCAIGMVVSCAWVRIALLILLVANVVTGYSFVPWGSQAIAPLVEDLQTRFYWIMVINLILVVTAMWATTGGRCAVKPDLQATKSR